MVGEFVPGPKSALILLDYQSEFLDAGGRMPVSRQHVAPVIASTLEAIAEFKARNRPIVAIGNEFRVADFVKNLLRRYASLKGSRGARWDPRIPLDGATYFPKWAASAFVNPEFERWLRREGIEELALGGMFASACVSATAKAALARGFRVRLLEGAIACSNDRTKARALARLTRAGAKLAA
jgi:nicotinamidase-related amidase